MFLQKFSGALIIAIMLQVVVAGAQAGVTGQTENGEELQELVDSLKQQVGDLEEKIDRLDRRGARSSQRDPQYLGRRRGNRAATLSQRYRYKIVEDYVETSSQFGELNLNGSAVVSFQSLLNDPGKRSSAVGSFDLFLSNRFSEQVRLFFDFEVIGGNGPAFNEAPLSCLNGDAGSTQSGDCLDRINLLEAWAEFEIMPSVLKIHAGKIDLTNYFDNNQVANDENSQFLGDMFVNSASLAAPVNRPGIRIQTTPAKNVNLQAGLSSIDNSGDSLLVNLFKIGSLGYRFFANTNYEANLRIYGYERYLNQSGLGWGLSYDGLAGNGVRYFMRYGENSDDLITNFPVESAWSGGGEYQCNLAGRCLKIGAAFGRINQAGQDHSENNIEIYTRHKLNNWSYVSLHYQSLWSSDFDDNIANLVGMRTNFNF